LSSVDWFSAAQLTDFAELCRGGTEFALKAGKAARDQLMQTGHNWRNNEKKARGIDAGTGNGNRELVVVARNDRIA
jgi:hypothetical protein